MILPSSFQLLGDVLADLFIPASGRREKVYEVKQILISFSALTKKRLKALRWKKTAGEKKTRFFYYSADG